MKTIFILGVLSLITSSSFSAEKPDETKVFFHLHQATRWTELLYQDNCLFSKSGAEKHLASIKYSQARLVDSIFYPEYIYLRNVSFGDIKSSIGQIEIFRKNLHSKAEKNKVKHPVDWQAEFIVCKRN